MLSRLFRRLFLERLTAAYQAGRLEFFADHAGLAEPARFKAYVAALRKVEWVVYDLLLKAAAETLITIAADPKHLGARIGLTAVLHTWG